MGKLFKFVRTPLGLIVLLLVLFLLYARMRGGLPRVAATHSPVLVSAQPVPPGGGALLNQDVGSP